MMKKLLFSLFLLSGISFSIANAQVSLSRATTLPSESTYTYTNGLDAITYMDESGNVSLQGVANTICTNVSNRVLLKKFKLNVKSTSVGKITLFGYSSGNSKRVISEIRVGNTLLVEGTGPGEYSTISTINNNSVCGSIIVNGLNILRNETTGTDITISISTVGGTSLAQVNLAEIILTSIETLPLKFLSFTAKPAGLGSVVNLNWKTTNEVNTKDFMVERRTENTEFATIGTLKSKNETGIQDYSFVDQAAMQGVNYYRLKQIDKDGASSYSEIANAEVKGNLTLSVFPNPATEKLNVQYATTDKSATIKIFSVDGKNLATAQVKKGSTTTDLSISTLNKGQYVLVYNDGATKSSVKFIKE